MRRGEHDLVEDAGFDIEVSDRDRRRLVSMRGVLDARYAEIADAVVTALVRSRRRFALDLTNVSLIDSAGLTVLVRAAGRLREGGRTLTITGASATVRHVLYVSGLDQLVGLQQRPGQRSTAPWLLAER